MAAGGDLGRVRHHEDLNILREPRQALADGIGDGASDAAVDLVEDEGREAGGTREADPEREQEARPLAAGCDLRQRAQVRSGVGRQHEAAAVDAGSALRPLRHPVERRVEARPLELERAQLGGHRPIQFLRRAQT